MVKNANATSGERDSNVISTVNHAGVMKLDEGADLQQYILCSTLRTAPHLWGREIATTENDDYEENRCVIFIH